MNSMFKNGMRPVHPGEILREDFLKPAGLTANALARALKVPAPRINEVVRKRRGISADTALRLARYFGGDARSWLNLQTAYDLRVAEIANAKRVAREVRPAAASLPRDVREQRDTRVRRHTSLRERLAESEEAISACKALNPQDNSSSLNIRTIEIHLDRPT
jgi:addiction module HigA family antidote